MVDVLREDSMVAQSVLREDSMLAQGVLGLCRDAVLVKSWESVFRRAWWMLKMKERGSGVLC